MPHDLLTAIDGILQVLSLGSDIKTLADRSKVAGLVASLASIKHMLATIASNSPFGPSPIQVAELSKATAEVVALADQFRPFQMPSTRALTILSEALKATVALSCSGGLSRQDALRSIEGIEKIIPRLQQDYAIKVQRQ